VRGCKNPRLEEAWLVGRPASGCKDGSTRTFFPKKGSRLPSPTSVPQAYLHHICLNALVKGIIRPETREQLLTIVDRLQKSHGIQALILGGTELSLILREPTVRDTPVLDTTKIHAKAIVAESFLPYRRRLEVQIAAPPFVAWYQARNCRNAVPRWLYCAFSSGANSAKDF
jgi:hypothetical protein